LQQVEFWGYWVSFPIINFSPLSPNFAKSQDFTMNLQIKKSCLLLLWLASFSMLSAQTIVTCQTCNGHGTLSVRERVPVRKDITYNYEGTLTKTYTNVVYDTRHVERACYACNGSGQTVLKPRPPRKTVSKPSPPPPPPPTLKENIAKRFGYGFYLSKTTVGKERLRVVTYKPEPYVSVNALLRIKGNQFDVLLDGYTTMYLLRDEYNRFDGLYLKDKATGKYAMADNNGRIVYRADHGFDRINARGDIWQGTERVREVGDKREREYELINYKTKERLSPGISLNDYCVCKELWTEKGLIDIELPHAVLGDRRAIGLMNRDGEILVPPVYKEVLDCDPSLGRIRFLDEEGYVYDFDYLGRLLNPSQDARTETCPDGTQIVHSKVPALTTSSSQYKKEDLELMDRVVLHHPTNQALDGLIFREAGCPNEQGWAKVLPPNTNEYFFLHTSGRLASTQEKNLSNVEIGKMPRVPFQRPSNQVPEVWFVAKETGGQVGGRLAYRNEEDELEYRTIKPSYQRVVSRSPQQVLVQAPNGLWGILAKEATLKPKYEELYQIRPWSYLGVRKGESYQITFDYYKQKFKTEAVSKLSIMGQGHFERLLKYNRQVPHQLEDMEYRLKNGGISPDEPLSGREIIIEQPGDQRHQAYWFTQNDRHHLVIFINNNYESDGYFHYKLPSGTTDVADAVYVADRKNPRRSDDKGYIYIPYRVGEEPYRLIQFHREKFDRVKDPAMEFDAVYAVPIPTDEGPHTLVFENESGYFTLYRGTQGGKKRGATIEKLGLKLLGVK
jgi:hypothetical protein